jgi:carbonic anhydrase
MKKITTYTTVALASMFLLSACSSTTAHAKEASTHHAKHWGYSSDVGPSHWSALNEKFHMCSEGKEQSPINLVPTKDLDLAALNINYNVGSKSQINNGHTVQVNIKAGNTLDIDGTTFELKQFHFHTPSENHINGKAFPMEAHFVHASKDGKLAVIAVMFKEGAKNPTLNMVLKNFPLTVNKESKLEFTKEYLNVMLPSSLDYYEFMGSLTTPPCSEKVRWIVLKNPISASKEQIAIMHKEIGMDNNRPIQESNKRVIEE